MNVLVYGAGVIGCYLAHVLCKAGNEVTLLARGVWKTRLELEGLTIRHYLQRKTTVDHSRHIGALDPGDRYDAVFAVMQYQQMWSVLDALAANVSSTVVLVGNNLSASEMERYLQEHSGYSKKVVFGFQGTGGHRSYGRVVCVRKGAGGLTCGGIHHKLDMETTALFSQIFRQSPYRISYVDDMEAWYACHAAFILPICYVCYANDCNLKHASCAQLRQLMQAVREGYGLLMAAGYPVLPKGDEAYFEPGLKKTLMSIMLWVMARTEIGRLAASDHCRTATTELQTLNNTFDGLRARFESYPMPAWAQLERYMPQKEETA